MPGLPGSISIPACRRRGARADSLRRTDEPEPRRRHRRRRNEPGDRRSECGTNEPGSRASAGPLDQRPAATASPHDTDNAGNGTNEPGDRRCKCCTNEPGSCVTAEPLDQRPPTTASPHDTYSSGNGTNEPGSRAKGGLAGTNPAGLAPMSLHRRICHARPHRARPVGRPAAAGPRLPGAAAGGQRPAGAGPRSPGISFYPPVPCARHGATGQRRIQHLRRLLGAGDRQLPAVEQAAPGRHRRPAPVDALESDLGQRGDGTRIATPTLRSWMSSFGCMHRLLTFCDRLLEGLCTRRTRNRSMEEASVHGQAVL